MAKRKAPTEADIEAAKEAFAAFKEAQGDGPSRSIRDEALDAVWQATIDIIDEVLGPDEYVSHSDGGEVADQVQSAFEQLVYKVCTQMPSYRRGLTPEEKDKLEEQADQD